MKLLAILFALSLPSFASLPHQRTIERRPAEQPSRGQMRVVSWRIIDGRARVLCVVRYSNGDTGTFIFDNAKK